MVFCQNPLLNYFTNSLVEQFLDQVKFLKYLNPDTRNVAKCLKLTGPEILGPCSEKNLSAENPQKK